MIDTIHFLSAWKVTRDHPDWEIRENKVVTATGEPVDEGSLLVRHRKLKIRAKGSLTSRKLTFFSVPSLSQLLFGQNGVPLNGQPDIDAALEVLDRLFAQVAEPENGAKRRYKRVDMSLNLVNAPFERIEPVIQRAALPGSRLAVRHYVGESLTFYRNQTELQIYNKTKKAGADGLLDPTKHEQVTRMELRLHNDDLDRELARSPGKGVQELDIMDCYRVFRKHVMSLTDGNQEGIRVVPEITGIDSYLAYVSTRDAGLFDAYVSTKSSDWQRQLKRKVAKLAPAMAEVPVNWDLVLPEGHPPAQTQIIVPGSMPGYLRPIVEEVLSSRGMGRGAHLLHDRHLER
ncbi:hypothetical protein [Luteolibacter sp. LG18]|uniref:hypothetical protein n=1 Tax=Luteolibacter sp. LG18 TaxID=2819286 RepID=UPI002B2B5FCE|nr:hypothetical protein llg_15610 [Luteolibacter sp. LG18]